MKIETVFKNKLNIQLIFSDEIRSAFLIYSYVKQLFKLNIINLIFFT
jgi:hypothetical protein